MVERAPLPQHPNIPGPLAFDQKGRLHHVYLVSTGAGGGRAIRSLVHCWREPSGEWRDEIAVSVHAGPMNAHIGLALIPNGQPVVLAERGLPFDEVADLDWNTAFIVKNERRDYGEDRYRVLGKIGDRLYAVVFTPREDEIRVISFRRANRREEVLYDRAREQERGR